MKFSKPIEKFLRKHPKICKFFIGRICPKCNEGCMCIITTEFEECSICGYKLYKKHLES